MPSSKITCTTRGTHTHAHTTAFMLIKPMTNLSFTVLLTRTYFTRILSSTEQQITPISHHVDVSVDE